MMFESLNVKKVDNGYLLEATIKHNDVEDGRWEDKTFVFTKPTQVIQAVKAILNQKG